MKKIYFFAAIAAVALSSCSKNEVTEVLPSSDNINSIGLSVATGVTRGVETTTEGVEKTNSITLSYVDKASKTENLKMEYNDVKDAWDQETLAAGNATLWSSLSLPASFYSMHDGSAPMTAASLTTAAATFDAYTPAAAIAEQKDLVCYAGSISAMPLAGYIRGDFNHALSRVEIYSEQGSYIPHVKTVDFMNVKDSGTATLAVAGTCTWTPSTTATSYEYLNALKSTQLKTTDGGFVSASQTAGATNNMIIIPQTLANANTEITTFDGSSDPVVKTAANYKTEAEEVKTTSKFTKIKGSYVKSLYRMQDASKADVAGYAKAEDCIPYQTMIKNGVQVLPTTINDDSELYVLVGFPFVDDQKFEVNKDYDVYLGFGTNGGHLLYNYYFDAEGNPTNIKVYGIEANDPVINPDAPIGIMVNVTAWKKGGDITIVEKK